MKTHTWIFWIIAHIIGYPVALMIGFIAIHLFAFVGNLLPEIIASGLGYILWGGIVGGFIGLFQWYFFSHASSDPKNNGHKLVSTCFINAGFEKTDYPIVRDK